MNPVNDSLIGSQPAQFSLPPNIPKELIDKIFFHLTLSEICRLGYSCKKWNKYTGPYLSLLKTEVRELCSQCEDSCMIPAYKIWGEVEFSFACNLKGRRKIIAVSSKKFDLDFYDKQSADFYIRAKIQVLNIPIDDSAILKKFIMFFRTGRCIDFACTPLHSIQGLAVKYDLNQIKKERVIVIHKAMVDYLNYRNKLP